MLDFRALAIGAILIIAATGASQMAQRPGSSGARVTVERWESLGLEVQELMLANGFRILLVEDRRVPRVAASLYYRIGALQEHYGEHGATHFLEHAIHQGTTTVGVKDRETDRALLRTIYQTEQELLAERNAERNRLRERNVFFDEGDWPASEKEMALRQKLYQLEDEQSKHRIFWEEYNWYRRHGGIMRHTDPVPANTGNEMMRIEVDLPKERIELFFRLEADRMVNAVLRGWEAQRFTVLEQFFILQRHDTGRFTEALNGVTGLAHPIYIHTGGHLRDHGYWNRASMLRMYDAYIVPNNATLTLVGDIRMEEVRGLADAYFGKLPRAPGPPAAMDVEAEPPPGGTIRLDWLEPLDPQVIVRYRIPGVGHPDRPAFDVIARLLRGADGILAVSRTLSQPEADWQTSASQNGSPNVLTMQTRASRDEDLPALERVAQQAIERLRVGPIDEKALARIRSEFRFDWELQRSERGSLASQLGSFSTADEWRTMRAYLEARASATPDQIRRVAERYLVPWNQVIATTRRNPPARAEKTTVSAPPAVAQAGGGAR
jgi:predicted Zn-dependent peptidase